MISCSLTMPCWFGVFLFCFVFCFFVCYCFLILVCFVFVGLFVFVLGHLPNVANSFGLSIRFSLTFISKSIICHCILCQVHMVMWSRWFHSWCLRQIQNTILFCNLNKYCIQYPFTLASSSKPFYSLPITQSI